LRKQTLIETTNVSPLQEKLSIIADQIGTVGLSIAILIVLIIWIKISVNGFGPNKEFKGMTDGNIALVYIQALIIGISVIVCAIPEGLPLAVTITLAYSVKKMMDDNNLVKKINSCETMGNADCICTDKTGTLTENLMSIMEFWFNQKQ